MVWPQEYLLSVAILLASSGHLSIICRPFYLPREFSAVIATAVYIPPQADTSLACLNFTMWSAATLTNILTLLLSSRGILNKANLRQVMPNFHQHVSCPTRGPNTLDQCYSQFKNAYKARSLPAFGKSDHAAIFLTHRNTNKGSHRNPRWRGKWRVGPPTLKLCCSRLLMTSTGTCSGRAHLTSASSRRWQWAL